MLSPQIQQSIRDHYPKLPPQALTRAETFYEANPRLFQNKNYVTIVNFDQPSTEERLYLIQTRTGQVQTLLVSHGEGSADENNPSLATSFSNVWNSLRSSLGVYRTYAKDARVTIKNPEGEYDSTGYYQGRFGWSLRLQGLESTNSQVLNREIVVHGYSRTSYAYIEKHGFLGLTYGCPSVPVEAISALVDKIAGGSLYLTWSAQHSEE